MRDLKERTAYLRGLIEGTEFQQDEKEKMVWNGLMDFCDQVAEDLNELGDSQNEFADYIEAIDEDLSSLEKYFYDQDDSENELDVVFTRDNHGKQMELTCPQCKEEIYFLDEPGNYEVLCPECGQLVWNHTAGESKTVNQTDII